MFFFCKYSGNYIEITTISVVDVLGLVNGWALSYPISIHVGFNSPPRKFQIRTKSLLERSSKKPFKAHSQSLVSS